MNGNTNDGGVVVGTGGGKFGAPVRWVRPSNAAPNLIVWTATVMVGGIGDARRGHRTSVGIDMIVGQLPTGGWMYHVNGSAGGYTEKLTAQVADEDIAKTRVVEAAREIMHALGTRPKESASHPAIGPAVWPGV